MGENLCVLLSSGSSDQGYGIHLETCHWGQFICILMSIPGCKELKASLGILWMTVMVNSFAGDWG